MNTKKVLRNLRRALPLGGAMILVAFASAEALTPYLVKDLNPAASAASSEPHGFTTVGRRALFTANERELWASDGTAAGTVKLLEGLLTKPLAVAGGLRFFLTAPNETSMSDLWVTAGTTASTRKIYSGLWIRVLVNELPRENLAVPGQRRIFFIGDDGHHGPELWTSDGTAAGTRLVRDINPGNSPFDPYPLGLVWFRGRLFFTANDGEHGFSLWSSDGTEAGTRKFSDLGAVAQVGVADRLVLLATTADRGTELWVTDGNWPLIPMPEIVRGEGTPQFLLGWASSPFQTLGNRLVFCAFDGRVTQIWAADPLARTVKPLKRFGTGRRDIYFSSRIGGPSSILTFAIRDDAHGSEMWRTDGTTTGTKLVADLCPGPCNGVDGENGGPLGTVGGRALFTGSSLGSGRGSVWSTNGFTTERLTAECGGSRCSEPKPIGRAGARFLFQADFELETALFSTDGTLAGTIRIREESTFSESVYSTPSAEVPGQALFGAYDSEHGMELWRSDGTVAGTRLVRDLDPRDLGGSFPSDFRAFGSKVIFHSTNSLDGQDLWVSDGSPAGTIRLISGTSGSANYSFRLDKLRAVEVGGLLFFTRETGGSLADLWRTDGTPSGTFRLAQYVSDPTRRGAGFEQPLLARLGSGVVFSAGQDSRVDDQELWYSDGTEAGTRLAADIVSGAGGSFPQSFTAFDGRIYFSAEGNADHQGAELWSTDGTRDGTRLVADIQLDDYSIPQGLVEFHGRLWFVALDQLWSTDGTTAGTRFESELSTGPHRFSLSEQPIIVNDRLLIAGEPNGLGVQAIQQTQAGAILVENLPFNYGLSARSGPVFWNGSLLVSRYQGLPVDSTSLWRTDGTPNGTVPFFPGSDSTLVGPIDYVVFGGKLLVGATRGRYRRPRSLRV